MFTGVRSVPMVAGLHSSRSVGAMLESLQGQAVHCHWRNLPQLAEAGLERDDYSESLEHLLQFAECYNEEFEVWIVYFLDCIFLPGWREPNQFQLALCIFRAVFKKKFQRRLILGIEIFESFFLDVRVPKYCLPVSLSSKIYIQFIRIIIHNQCN